MPTFNNNLGMWRASTGGYFGTEAEAKAAEQGNAPAAGLDDLTIAPEVGSGAAPPPPPDDFDPREANIASGRLAGDGGSFDENVLGGGYQDGLGYVKPPPKTLGEHVSDVGRIGAYAGSAIMNPLGTFAGDLVPEPVQLAVNPVNYLGSKALDIAATGIPGGSGRTPAGIGDNGYYGGGTAGTGVGGAPPGGDSSALTDQAASDALARGDAYDANQVEKDAANAEDWGRVWEQFGKVDEGDYGLSDEARGYQREGLQQQRELLERLLGFDPNQYASQFADQALARSIAAGRSAGGGYAAQQAGMFAAQDQMPALQAEGARMAAQMENQRLQAAAGVAKTFGDLGTMTRGQDETRAQFDATLPLEIANSLASATQGKASLDEAEAARFADVYMHFANLQSVYAGMDSNEQLAWWDQQMKEKELGQQWAMFKQELAAQGKVTSKDIIGGLFQLGGGVITSGGSILAAKYGNQGKAA